MKRSTHLALGAAAVAPLALSQGFGLAVATVWFGLAGAAFPDWLDFRSDFRQPLRLKHRGVSHSLLALVIVVAATWVCLTMAVRNPIVLGDLVLSLPPRVPSLLALAFGIGFGTHLLADSCTPAGIEPLLPISKSRFWLLPRRMRGKTGGKLDGVTRWLAVTAVAFAMVIAAGRWLDLPA